MMNMNKLIQNSYHLDLMKQITIKFGFCWIRIKWTLFELDPPLPPVVIGLIINCLCKLYLRHFNQFSLSFSIQAFLILSFYSILGHRLCIIQYNSLVPDWNGAWYICQSWKLQHMTLSFNFCVYFNWIMKFYYSILHKL